ncbi:related to G1/S-specific cyclin pas1 [Rhynchosporium graminicola]|uniref:Related to G1/S-specific cyclin pas1 n=1 Tax=Rhynchosporium graminicola TaxID=2792576 RepID=A0A1E1KKY4_9HELO|nr:related to G1/S-specific cyclin pas1 [Rhynchosporium commune]
MILALYKSSPVASLASSSGIIFGFVKTATGVISIPPQPSTPSKMNCGEDDSPPYITSFRNGPYSSSLASSASSSSASVWSDASSQSSDDSSVTGASSDNEIPEKYCYTSRPAPSFTTASTVCEQAPAIAYWSKHKSGEVATEQRHPRRTSVGASTRTGFPPSLVRQCDRKVNFVDGLVDSSAQIVEAIWPLSSVVCRSETGSKGVLPLRTFIQETLRRSRTSYSTLQVALYYLILIKPHVPKHDFTMEQPDDAHSIRALQCGRRMFLSALILASKYLQDRNFSARAWSKISGLNTLEINQNEMAFLLAVNWELHITEAVFQRWTDIVLGNRPTQPPSPGSASSRLAEQGWKSIILGLTPDLDNVEGLSSATSTKANVKSVRTTSPRSFTPMVVDRNTFGYGSNDATPTPKYYTPSTLEPSLSSFNPTSKLAPAFGLLPTPRMTPQSIGFNTPAVSAASYMLGKSSMGFAMAQASSVNDSQVNDKWQPHLTSSPLSYVSHRRSSLGNSVSSMSSPESMVSDSSSRSSRSSSISSASSWMSAPISAKLDVQARCRYAKLCSEKQNRTVIATVPEGYCDNGPTSSPESYTGPVGKGFLDLSLDTPLARRVDLDLCSKDEEAARALQELHNHPRSSESLTRAGAKRARPQSIDNSLQENVREILNGSYQPFESDWARNVVRTRSSQVMNVSPQNAVRSTSSSSLGRKRVCCATEAARGLPQATHPAFGGLGGPGMWNSILN